MRGRRDATSEPSTATPSFTIAATPSYPYGIDIAHTRPRAVVLQDEYLAGVPLRSFLDGPGVSPPEWAEELIAA